MRLWLLRHAKSSWDDRDMQDVDRPLAPRGARAADRMRDYLDVEEIRPELVLCSSALRTRETLARILPGLGSELTIRIESSVYSFEAGELLDRLREVPADAGSVMLVGHNPAMQELASLLAADGYRLDDLRKAFPTAALAELVVPIGSWADLAPGSGRLERFVVPRELGSR
ncbi:MAG: histidine phosphatase family protein [Actinobacteria bacterium]|nr:MAG: histidine phosphatase family protein [Actinomycetota bacterium]